jgi:hypothetical protein
MTAMREPRQRLERLEAIEKKLDALLEALSHNGDSRYLLSPAKQIAKACGVCDRTVRKWTQDQRHPLKVFHGGKGLTTTLGLLDDWVRERWSEEQRTPPPRKGRPLVGKRGAVGVGWRVNVS